MNPIFCKHHVQSPIIKQFTSIIHYQPITVLWLLTQAFWPITCMLNLQNQQDTAGIVHNLFWHHTTFIAHIRDIINATQILKLST